MAASLILPPAWIPARRPREALSRKKEQGTFANWLLRPYSEGRKIPFVLHTTHKPSRATIGCPDFWVGVKQRGLWIEFKANDSCKLSPEQEEFRVCCAYQGFEWRLVYSAQQAIGIVSALFEDRLVGSSEHAQRGCFAFPHLALPLTSAHWAIVRGWAEPHFSGSFGFVPPGVMVVYTPRDEQEAAVFLSLFWISYNFALTARRRDFGERSASRASVNRSHSYQGAPVLAEKNRGVPSS